MNIQISRWAICALLLTACASGTHRRSRSSNETDKHGGSRNPSAILVGEWHYNSPEATKIFRSQSIKSCGAVYKLWPFGGTYRVLSKDFAKQLLKISCTSDYAVGDQTQETITADGNHMTFESVSGVGVPDAGLVFYRA